MPETIFFRLLDADDKCTALQQAVGDLSQELNSSLFAVDSNLFGKVGGTPFAYWVGKEILSLFGQFEKFESEGRSAALGLTTNKDFRFLRLFCEVQAVESNNLFYGLAKGGIFSPYYSDIVLSINWKDDGKELKEFSLTTPGTTHWSRNIRSPDKYFRPGLTWPRRTSSNLSLRALPRQCLFADKGPAIFVANDNSQDLLAYLAITNSALFRNIVSIQLAAADAAARSYEVGLIQRTPVPALSQSSIDILSTLANRAWSLKRGLDTISQTSHAFTLPALIQTSGDTLTNRGKSWTTRVTIAEQQLADIQTEIDGIACKLYGVSPEETNSGKQSIISDVDTEEDEDITEPTELPSLTHSLIEYALGTALGRFDIRLATREREHPPEPEPFDPLPACSPGMLVTDNHLPPTTSEELPPNYPIDIPFDGILVDDESHPNDIIRRIRPVFDIIFSTQAGDIEQEACQLLKTDSLRNYFAKPNAFFTQHLSRYSKSRRAAPIYWPLSTPSGSYTLWIYYHRLTDQTLYTCINNYIEPKLTQTSRAAIQLLAQTNRTTDDETHLETLQTLEQELTELRDELLGIAQLPYKPNLNDGIQITAAPLWKCFRLKKWQTKLEGTWKQLEKGDYDWAHLAYSIWPERVAEKCKQDKSLAIAHDLENLYEPPPEKPKKQRKRSRKKT